ncbi:MAG: 3-deoxy-D-manno-octulosonic acid transferase [Pseudomonadota bacterium]
MLLGLYRGFTTVFGPMAPLFLDRRAARGKEDPARRPERLGQASRPRPTGKLVWIHGASVGEAMSAQILIDRLLALDDTLHVLLTTGTVTSARLFEERLPPSAIHQFVPIDRPDCVTRFLDHWRPDLAIWLESELWPNLLDGVARRSIPAVLANARLSQRSFSRWSLLPGLARRLIGTFDLVLPGDAKSAERYQTLGARALGPTGNLKYSAPVLPADPASVEALRGAIGDRPVWLAASTHPGEDQQVIDAHTALAGRFPGLLTIIAPRHVERRPEIAGLIAEAGLDHAVRSAVQLPDEATDIYLADTLGELGTLFRAVPIVFVGGSLVPIGGHNPLEPARLGCAILTGPKTENFADVFAAMEAEDAVQLVQDGPSLTEAVGELLSDPNRCAALAKRADQSATARAAVIDAAMQALQPLLSRAGLTP